MKTVRADIVFKAVGSFPYDKWYGRLLNPSLCRDAQDGMRPLSGRPQIVITEGPDGFTLMIQGAGVGGRRYSTWRTCTEAQEAAMKWAGRRFRIPVDVAHARIADVRGLIGSAS